MKIRKESAWIFILFFIVLMPELFTQIKLFFYSFSLIAIFIFLYFIFRMIRNRIYPSYFIVWIIASIYLLLAMFFNQAFTDIDQWGKTTIFVSDVMLLLDYYMQKGKSKQVITVLSNMGVIFFAINCIVIILFPKGLISSIGGNYYFLGTRNSILKYFFAFLCVTSLECFYYKKKRNLMIFLCLSVGQFIFFKVSTAITCALIILGLFIFRKIFLNKLNMRIILLTSTVLSVLFIFFNASNIFSFFIENVLHKDLGLNNRSLIWKQAVQVIFSQKSKMIFGHGIQNNGNFVLLYNIYWPAHNQLLEWVYEYGIVGSCILYKYFLSLEKKIEIGMDSYLIYAIIFASFIGGISSGPLSGAPGYLALCFLPYINELRKSC